MIKIVAKIDFKQYKKGGVYDVDEQDAAKFCRNGWAYDMTGNFKTRTVMKGEHVIQPHTTKLKGKAGWKE